jgi:hypothetical protein
MLLHPLADQREWAAPILAHMLVVPGLLLGLGTPCTWHAKFYLALVLRTPCTWQLNRTASLHARSQITLWLCLPACEPAHADTFFHTLLCCVLAYLWYQMHTFNDGDLHTLIYHHTCDLIITPACLQASFFFGYNALMCYALVLLFGSVGFRASLLFVRHIYRCGSVLRMAPAMTITSGNVEHAPAVLLMLP